MFALLDWVYNKREQFLGEIMKFVSLFIGLAFFCSLAQAKDKKKEPEKTNLNAAIEDAAKKSILQDLKINVEVKHDSSICGSNPGDIVLAEVLLKKAGRDEKGQSKDRWETIESYGAPLAEFQKNGSKAFMKEGQCLE